MSAVDADDPFAGLHNNLPLPDRRPPFLHRWKPWQVALFVFIFLVVLIFGGGFLFIMVMVMVMFGGVPSSFQIGGKLAIGWFAYLGRVLPQLRIDQGALLTGILCLVGVTVGLHWLACWLRAQRPTAQPWRKRWTVALVTLVILMFVAGIAATGLAHHTTWLMNDPEPMVRSYP